MISIEITPESSAYIARLGTLPARIGKAIAAAIDHENQFTISHISLHKLSARGADTLGVRSGRLRQSVHATPAIASRTAVVSTIGSNVKYAAVHEYGCGPFVIRARGAALRWNTPSGPRFARSVRHPGFPARAMFSAGISERLDDYSSAVSAAILREAGK